MHNQVNNIKAKYKEKEFDIECKNKSKIKSLEKNNHLNKLNKNKLKTMYFYDKIDKERY